MSLISKQHYKELKDQDNIKEDDPKDLTLFQLMSILRPYYWPNEGSDGAVLNRIRAISTYLSVFLSKASSLYAPFFLLTATNELMAGNISVSILCICKYCLLRIVSSFFKELQPVIYVKVKQQASIELQEIIFSHLHSLSFNWHLSKKTGSVIKSMDRSVDAANQLIQYLFLFLIPALCECLAVVFLFFIRYQKHSALGVAVLLGVFFYTIATIVIAQWRKKFREANNKLDNDYHDIATDSIMNYETVKYFTAESSEVSRYKECIIKFQQVNTWQSISNSLLNIIQQIILYTSLFGAMVISAQAVQSGDMSIGEWVAVQAWVVNVFAPLNALGMIYSMIIQALLDMKSLSQLLSEASDVLDIPGAVDIPVLTASNRQRASTEVSGIGAGGTDIEAGVPLADGYSSYGGLEMVRRTPPGPGSGGVSVEFCSLFFSYPQQSLATALRNVSFYVPAGTTTAIVGHTGSGKTTLSRLLFRFYDPHAGFVSLGNYDISKYTQRSVRSLVGIVPQDTMLFNDTLLYNVRFGRPEASLQQVREAAAAAQILDFIEALPDGWNTAVGERGLKLSGGERQRVAIARCLLKDPPVVVFDEATSALDTATEFAVQEALRRLGHGRTVIVIAHRLATVKAAQQIVVLDQGEVVEKGTHEELIRLGGSGHYARLWGMQG